MKKCKQCGGGLDCHSVCRCSKCLFKERIYDERRRHGGWNPSNLSEQIEINESPFNGIILGVMNEDNKDKTTK